MNEKSLILKREEEIALITINRPEVLNALNIDTLNELCEAFAKLNADHKVKVVIITGNGKAFIAGADISEMKDYTAEQAREFTGLGHMTMDTIQNAEKPIIAAVNGYALGGGLELALACDIILASETALLGVPEVNLGIIQGFGGTQRLPRLVGKFLAKELIFTADAVTAKRAYEMGMVNRIFPPDDLLPEAKKLALKIAQKGPIALRLAKRVIDIGYNRELSEGCKLEMEAFVSCFNTSDRKEGMRAFLEKRKPIFTNR
ncbi:MAG: crotonase [Deltaproteobacteria bacterium DG_8]|nr:MAG: crotonase [Deltaproteobacteria bacterium DG_8]